MLVTVITEKQYHQAKDKIQYVMNATDIIELRLDYFADFNIRAIQELKQTFSIPMIFTLRKKSQGGLFFQPEDKRLCQIEELSELNPAFIDLEYDVPIEFAIKLKTKYPAIGLICSYHDFVKTPDNLEDILNEMRHEVFTIYKIVPFAQSTLDCLKVLRFVKTTSSSTKLTSFCMGEYGIPSRVLGPIIGNRFNYACANDNPVAPGQLSIFTMKELYRVNLLDQDSNIYALLGNPIDKSAGHIIHNKAFAYLNKKAIYVKFNVKLEELQDFFKLITLLPFKGFSVTMPLKEHVMPYLDQIDKLASKIGSVNTIVVNKKQFIGYNTDAQGALNAIENKTMVANKTVVILGAGGAGRAIAYEARKRKAKVILLNRGAKKSYDVAKEIGCVGYGMDELNHMHLNYDVLVNTTPLGMSGQLQDLPIPEKFLIPHTIVMDTVYNPIETPLLCKAQEHNCILIYGYEMFINQAIRQLQLWFGKLNNYKEVQQICLKEWVHYMKSRMIINF